MLPADRRGGLRNFNQWEDVAMTTGQQPPAPRRGGRPPSGEPVLDRAFRILDVFSAEEPALTLTALSDRTGIPISTVLRLSQRLMGLGVVERLPDGTFTMGIRMLEYAALAPRGHGLRASALPYMEDLHRATGQHVQLAVREKDVGVIVERLSAGDAGRVLYYAGGRIPLHGTGLGLVLLAHSRPEFQEAYLRRDLVLAPEALTLDPSDLGRRLEEVRGDGVARYSRTLPEPVDTVAAPVFDRAGACVAALSVLAAGGTVDLRRVEPAVVAIARAISRELGRSSV
jgi:DNA-binding IclR family transcriptional regulator